MSQPARTASSDASPSEGEALTLVVLGADGALTRDLLLPGLGSLLGAEPDRSLRLVGVGLADLSQDEWRGRISDALDAAEAGHAAMMRLAESSSYHQLELPGAERLASLLDGLTGQVVVYFALPPAVSVATCEALRGRRLPEGVRLVFEKPFGDDLAAAQRLNGVLADLVDEAQVFRVDGFLGEGAVLSVLGLRFANQLLEQAWHAGCVASINVVADETIALEGRASFYDGTGALVDMLQSHLLLLMALTMMERPERIDAACLGARIGEVLAATRIWDDDPVASSRRARYAAGEVDGQAVPAYRDEEGVDPELGSETLAELVCEVATERWAGVPVRLRSGKALDRTLFAITVRMHPVADLPDGLGGDQAPANTVTIGIYPSEVRIGLNTNSADDKLSLQHSTLSSGLAGGERSSYGELLGRVLDGDHLLTVPGAVAEELWRIVTPVLEAWQAGLVPLQEYPAGTRGPWE